MARQLKVETIEAHPQVEDCPNCSAQLRGRYCHECGQKKITHHDLSVKHFFGHLAHEITHLDSNKILKTVVALLFQPGRLTEEYLAGRRGQYINPIRVYLTVSALYFFFGWGTLLNAGGFQPETQRWFIALAQQKGVDPRALADKVRQKAEKSSAVLRFSSVLVSGLFLTALYRRRGKYYIENLTFSLHYYSFDFSLRCLIALLLVGFSAVGWPLTTPVRAAFYLVLFCYLFYALRRVYRESRLKTLVKSAVLFTAEVALFFVVIGIAFVLAFSTI
jgi:hypothetical protein